MTDDTVGCTCTGAKRLPEGAGDQTNNAPNVDDSMMEKRTPKKRLSEEELEAICATAANNPNLNHGQLAAIAGTERSTITRVLQRYDIHREKVEEFKSHRADIFAGIQEQIIKTLTPAEIKKATLMQRMAAVGILYDKERLERGGSDAGKSQPLVVINRGGNVQVNVSQQGSQQV